MRFLIDEDVPSILADWLLEQGHDLLLASEAGAGQTDLHWLALAELESRIVVTSDKDFGELIYRDNLNSHGILLLRLHDLSLADRLARLKHAWDFIEQNSVGRFVVGERSANYTLNRTRVGQRKRYFAAVGSSEAS